MDKVNELVFMMKISEQSERYQDMVELAKKLVEESPELDDEQRNLVSVAYKNIIGVRRAACRSLSAVEEKFEGDQSLLIDSYRSKIEKEVDNICNEIIKLLDEKLLPNARDDESKVFFYKMKGDYYRYLGEFKEEDARVDIADESDKAYEEAMDAAEKLVPTNPIKLGLALNRSVFYYEIRNDPARACQLAKEAFDHAIVSLDTLTEDSYKDTTLIVQLLRDNLTLWSSDMDEDMEEGAALESAEVEESPPAPESAENAAD